MDLPKFDMPAPTAIDNPTATSLDRSDQGTNAALYRAAIGTVNLDYYLPIFTRLEATRGSGLSWNSAACQYTLNWMIYRRLWGAALAYCAVVAGTVLVVFGVDRNFFQFSETPDIVFGAALAMLYFVVPGLYGNALLFASTRKKMANALATSLTLSGACIMLSQQASSRRRFIRIVLANLALLSAAALAYVMFQTSRATPVPAANPATVSAPPASAVASAVRVESVASGPVVAPSPPVPEASISIGNANTESRPATSTSTPATEPHFYINVGLFANPENAHNARRKLLMAGLHASTQDLKTKKGKRTRVRVGPFNTRSEVDSAVEKIHNMGLEAIAFSL